MGVVGQLRQAECPECAAALVSDPRFVTWCPGCGWNVDPTPPPRMSRREQRAARASERASRRLFEQMSEKGTVSSRGLRLRITVLSAAVHLLTLAVFAAGLYLVVDGFGMAPIVRFFIGGLLIGVGCVVQPFHRKRASGNKPLTRTELPSLFALCDQVAQTLGTGTIDSLWLSPVFNASYGRSRRHGSAMTLGLALWAILEPQERVALIGHELGHQLNGDQRRARPVRLAMVSLRNWAYLLKPGRSIYRTRGIAAVSEFLTLLVLLPLAATALGLRRLLAILAGRQGLSSEYYADELSARVAGTAAAAALAEKLLVADACSRFVQQTVKFEPATDPWEAVGNYARGIPQQEWERQRRLGRLRLPAIDSSHPPSQLRADLLRARAYQEPVIRLTPNQAEVLDRELARYGAGVAKRVRDGYLR